MRIARWIPRATNTNSDYVKLIACPLQQWLHESAFLLRYTYIACPVEYAFLSTVYLSILKSYVLIYLACLVNSNNILYDRLINECSPFKKMKYFPGCRPQRNVLRTLIPRSKCW